MQTPEFQSGSPNTDSSTATHHERRSSRRLHCSGRADVNLLDGHPVCAGRVHNLSLRGCCIHPPTASELPLGAEVEIVMDVDGIRFRVAGIVRFEDRRNGIGIEFLKHSQRCSNYIQDLIGELQVYQPPAQSQHQTETTDTSSPAEPSPPEAV